MLSTKTLDPIEPELGDIPAMVTGRAPIMDAREAKPANAEAVCSGAFEVAVRLVGEVRLRRVECDLLAGSRFSRGVLG